MILDNNDKLETRDYQLRIFNKTIDHLKEHNRKKKSGEVKKDSPATVMIQSPTGSGKTIMGQAVLKALSEGIIDGIKYNSLWMAHRRELLNQANKTNESVFEIPDFQTISMFDKNAERFFGEYKVIVIDEAQHDASTSAATIHNKIKPDIIIGLTATPYRTDKAQLCFQKVIQDAGIRQLIREGWLAPFKYMIMDGAWTPENVARVYMQQPDEWGPSVSYFLTVDEAKEMARLLQKRGIRAEAILGNTPRDEILEAFERGEIQHLTNCMVLTEGFDAPQLKTAFVRPSSKGPTVQMAGRAFRKHPSTPFVNIVQNHETRYAFTKHAEAIEQWLEYPDGGWRALDDKTLLPVVKQMILRKINTPAPKMPELIAKKAEGSIANMWV